ncbi:hypothetical protein COLO4_27220 [Corchorus olitorius]|uniref:Uncharacterized protein n=1 Tax=Corchorus olitorius TaxID=93759 RepID=A0A1R3HSR4_9ROSI|nr:hypothetical protein COLO4_27220 [Corchorus olitorius]
MGRFMMDVFWVWMRDGSGSGHLVGCLESGVGGLVVEDVEARLVKLEIIAVQSRLEEARSGTELVRR